MKKIFVLALSALMVAAFAVPSMAKVNLSGAIWVTYWAQQEGSVNAQSYSAANVWVENGQAGALAGNFGRAATASKKTFLVAQSRSGNGTSAKANAGDGFLLALDCPVNDWVKAYGEVDVFNAGNLALQQGYINLAFRPEINVRVGLQDVPFGMERGSRPTVGQEEVFVSDYSQDANGLLQIRRDVGVQALGTLANGLVDYNVFVGNGAPSTVSSGDIAASLATPDINDAKQVGVNLNFKPFTGATVGGAYYGADYTTTVANNGALTNGQARATAYDLNAGYEYGNIFALSAEYATSRHDKASPAYALAVPAPGANTVAQNRVNEYIIKGIYTGVADWEFGVRYGVIDPKNIEAEAQAGYSIERKVSFATGYKFARAAFLKAEYSWLRTSADYVTRNQALAAGTVRQNPTEDVDDNIFALSLGLQF